MSKSNAQVKLITKSDDLGAKQKPIKKADDVTAIADDSQHTTEWIDNPLEVLGLRRLVDDSTILPQCIAAYKQNIVGFGIDIAYIEDYEEETEEMKAEYDYLKRIVEMLNLDRDVKEEFEHIIEEREICGTAFCEVIRDIRGLVNQLVLIKDGETVSKTVELGDPVEYSFFYNGEIVTRKKRFCKYRQTKNGKTVYFKEFGDPRIMDLRTGDYLNKGETLENQYQANEVLEFPIGTKNYGLPRWFGTILVAAGSRKAEEMNFNYFINGRHTPLAIIVKGGTLSDESFTKLQGYMDDIRGENGQHAFLVLEVENTEETTGFEDSKKAEIELKDLSPMLQNDALFQDYLESNRQKIQSAFRLPDLYTGYTRDFNRATAQVAMEITEQQVFIPERLSLEWIVNHKLLSGYPLKYCKVEFKSPKLTDYDSLSKILAIVKAGGGATPNDFRDLYFEALGKVAEPFTEDWGDVPIEILTKTQNKQPEPAAPLTDEQAKANLDNLNQQIEGAINKAMENNDTDVVPVMKEVVNLLKEVKKNADK